jgi:hypothetical protein
MFKHPFRLFILIALVLSVSITGFARPAAAQDATCGINLDAAFKWLATFQNDDGGFTNGFQPASDVSATADALVAIVNAGKDPAQFVKGQNTALNYLEAQVKAGKVDNVGKLGKVLMALMAVQADVTAFGGVNLVEQTQQALEKDMDSSGLFGQALAMLPLAQLDAEIPETAVDRLLKAQDKKGGWGFGSDQAVDSNTTALVVRVLATLVRDDEVAAPLSYLKSIQNADKGWPFQNPSQYGTDSDANSTALVLDALTTLGERLSDWGNPQDALKQYQQADGSFTFQLKQPAPSFLATVAAIPSLCSAAQFGAGAPVPTAEATKAK